LTQDEKRAKYVLTEIQKLYAIERKTKDLSAEERYAIVSPRPTTPCPLNFLF